MGNVLSSEQHRCSPCRASSHVATLLWGCHGSGWVTRRCGWHMGASVRWEWGQGEVRGESLCWGRSGGAGRVFGKGLLSLCMATLPWAGRDAVGRCCCGGPRCEAGQRLATLLGQNSAAEAGAALQPCPRAGAVGSALTAMTAPARRLRAAQPGMARASNPAGASNVSASEYCSSLSLSGEIKKKREPSFLECNLPPATRSHVN